MREGITIIIPTRNGGERFKKCLRAIKEQQYAHPVQLIVIDSGSSDGTLKAAENQGAKIIKIKHQDFHHSRTRNEALKHAIHDKVVFLVQDAIPVSSIWLNIMTKAIEGNDMAAAYGHHLPHDDADLFAWFETTSHAQFLGKSTLVQSINSIDSFIKMPYDRAVRLTQCDNVCAIYKRDLLNKVLFPDVVFGEDMAWAKTILLNGFKVKYDPSIQVRHSHNRSPDYWFRRALIGSFISASILERVRDDLSFLTCENLKQAEKILKSRQTRISELINRKKGYGQKSPAPILSVLYRNPLVKNSLAMIYERLVVLGGRRQWLFSFPRIVDARIGYILNIVKNAFPRATNNQLISCVDRTISLIKGNLYGVVAASYSLKGSLPPELSNLVSPFLQGL